MDLAGAPPRRRLLLAVCWVVAAGTAAGRSGEGSGAAGGSQPPAGLAPLRSRALAPARAGTGTFPCGSRAAAGAALPAGRWARRLGVHAFGSNASISQQKPPGAPRAVRGSRAGNAPLPLAGRRNGDAEKSAFLSLGGSVWQGQQESVKLCSRFPCLKSHSRSPAPFAVPVPCGGSLGTQKPAAERGGSRPAGGGSPGGARGEPRWS